MLSVRLKSKTDEYLLVAVPTNGYWIFRILGNYPEIGPVFPKERFYHEWGEGRSAVFDKQTCSEFFAKIDVAIEDEYFVMADEIYKKAQA